MAQEVTVQDSEDHYGHEGHHECIQPECVQLARTSHEGEQPGNQGHAPVLEPG